MYNIQNNGTGFVIQDQDGDSIVSSMDMIDPPEGLLSHLNREGGSGYTSEEIEGCFEIYDREGDYVAGVLTDNAASILLSHLNKA